MEHTLCWDCEKSLCERCSWSKDFTPVPGWEAEPTVKQNFRGQPLRSFKVTYCPEFKADAMGGGLVRIKKERERGGTE